MAFVGRQGIVTMEALANTGTYRLRIAIVSVVMVRTKSGPRLPGGEGGGLLHFARLAEEWVKQGHDVAVYTNLPGAFEGKCTVVYPLEVPNERPGKAGSITHALRTMLTGLRTRPRGLERASETEGDGWKSIVITASPNPPDLLIGRSLARASGSPLVVAFHHITPPPWWFPFRRGGLIRCTGAWVLGQVGLAVTKVGGHTPSIDRLRILQESGWRFAGPVLTDDEFLDPASLGRNPPNPNRTVEVCHISRLSPMKGIFDVLAVWDRVHKSLPTAKLLIGGDFESESVERKVDRILSQKGLRRSVTLLGPLSQSAKTEVLESSRLFLFPSYEEGWSRSVMEAASHGCVPVVYDLPAYDYLGTDLPRVPPGNTSEMSSVVESLLRDPIRLRRLALTLQPIPARYAASTISRFQAAFLSRLR